jgi:hypothetical protein
LHEEEIDAKFSPILEKANQEYMDFKDVIVLCKKCHMAVTMVIFYVQFVRLAHASDLAIGDASAKITSEKSYMQNH